MIENNEENPVNLIEDNSSNRKDIRYPERFYATEKECNSSYLRTARFPKNSLKTSKRSYEGIHHLHYKSYDGLHINMFSWHGF